MNLSISSNTQVILLLTAPLITGQRATPNGDLLSQGEYRRFARHLRNLGHAPEDLLGANSAELLRELQTVIPTDRVRRLLDRGLLISQAIEKWQSRAIWVVSRADSQYPKKLKNRLKEDSPAVLYGCGQPGLLESGGLAVVGSRHVDQMLVDYTEAIARQCAGARKSVISGAAQGIDRAAMRGALEAGGRVVGVLADSLERAVVNRDNRNWILDEQLALISPYDPSAGFNVGHAMQRNKLIYALSDAALVVSAEYQRGGTWAGATEQLQKFRLVPVYVRSTGDTGSGLDALKRMGAQPWPNPSNSNEFSSVLGLAWSFSVDRQAQSSFASAIANPNVATSTNSAAAHTSVLTQERGAARQVDSNFHPAQDISKITDPNEMSGPAEALIACARKNLIELLTTPKTEKEIIDALQISKVQAKLWLQRFIREGAIEKRVKPLRYQLKERTLL